MEFVEKEARKIEIMNKKEETIDKKDSEKSRREELAHILKMSLMRLKNASLAFYRVDSLLLGFALF